MGISAREATRIHKLAQAAGIPDETIDTWSGGDTTITDERESGFKAAAAREVEQRIKTYAQRATTSAPVADPAAPRATERQISYITDLLFKGVDDPGMYALVNVNDYLIRRPYPNGATVDRAKLAAMTRTEASKLIDDMHKGN